LAADAVLKALEHVWISLEPLHAPMAMMGGQALAAWRHVRAIRDVDLLDIRVARAWSGTWSFTVLVAF
jgi:hypothetical protein